MNSKVKIALIVLCGATVIGVGMWRYLAASNVRPAHAVIVRDRSESVLSGCDGTAALVKRALDSLGIGAGSTVTITVTGDESTAGEPRLLASLQVPVNRRVLEGRSAVLKQREELLESVKTQCEKLPQTKSSPIFRAIRRAIEHLRSLGCGPGLDCVVYVQTDLEETDDGQVRRALNQPTHNKPALPAPLNNDAIDVVFSGVAETAGLITGSDGKLRQMTKSRDPGRAERIRSVWSTLFTDPERVRFEPYAPKQ